MKCALMTISSSSNGISFPCKSKFKCEFMDTRPNSVLQLPIKKSALTKKTKKLQLYQFGPQRFH